MFELLERGIKKLGRRAAPGEYRERKLLQRAAARLFDKEGARSTARTRGVFIVGIHDQSLTVEAGVWSKVFSQVARSRSAGESLVADGAHVHDGGRGDLGDGWNCVGCVT